MELLNTTICPTCGKDLKIITGECEVNYDREFYGGRVTFFQNKECECGSFYKLCITQTMQGLRAIDMFTAEKPVVEEEVVTETIIQPIIAEPTNPKLVTTIVNPKEQLMLFTIKELRDICNKKKIKTKVKDSKSQLIDRILSKDPKAFGIL